MLLSIYDFDVDPDLVTQVLEIEPTWIARKGEPLANGRLRRTNQWCRELASVPLTSGIDHETALKELTQVLHGRKDAFVELHKKVAPRKVEIWSSICVDSVHASEVWLDPSTMRLLADCGVSWRLDIDCILAKNGEA